MDTALTPRQVFHTITALQGLIADLNIKSKKITDPARLANIQSFITEYQGIIETLAPLYKIYTDEVKELING